MDRISFLNILKLSLLAQVVNRQAKSLIRTYINSKLSFVDLISYCGLQGPEQGTIKHYNGF